MQEPRTPDSWAGGYVKPIAKVALLLLHTPFVFAEIPPATCYHITTHLLQHRGPSLPFPVLLLSCINFFSIHTKHINFHKVIALTLS